MNNDFTPPRGQNVNRFRPQPRSQTPPTPGAAPERQPLSFRTTEEVANDDAKKATVLGGEAPVPPHKVKKSFKQRLRELTKKQWIIIIAVAVLLLAGIGYAVYAIWIKADPPKPAAQVIKKVQPAPVVAPLTSTLTGLPIADASINKRPVTAVMIENSPDARPQSGLSQAGVVFEAIAEGGITRFLTLFQDTEPDNIGPVRSVRPYYVQWLAGFDAAVAHVGGSGDALAMLKNGEAKDLDQFYNPGPYHRISTRYAPHNMYSSVPALDQLQIQKGFSSTYTGFARKPEAKSAKSVANSIDFTISSATYNPHYDYDPATNSYKRAEGGVAHIDQNTGQQLAPKVVIAIVMKQGSNGIYTTYNSIGSGEAHVFQDGIETTGTWSKDSEKAQIVFKDASGAILKLNPGQTWISAVSSASNITVK